MVSPSHSARTRMADSSSRKDTTMRRNDLRGAHVWIGAARSIRDRTVCRLSGRKMSASWRFVKRRVLDGGVGWASGGMVLRSRDMLEGTEPEDAEDLLERRVGDELDDIFVVLVLCSGDVAACMLVGRSVCRSSTSESTRCVRSGSPFLIYSSFRDASRSLAVSAGAAVAVAM